MVRAIPKYAALWAAYAFLIIAAWIVSLRAASGMQGGVFVFRGVPVTLFLGMWVAMMTAMMFPSVAPIALMWSNAIARSSKGMQRLRRMLAFLGGYLLGWTLYGALVFGVLLGIAALAQREPNSMRWLGGALLLFAGIYQLTPLKRVCLRHCRSPLMFVMQHAAYTGRMCDLRVGLHHALYCVGCCWGIMVVLIAMGIMNVGAMAVLAIVIGLEKLWRHGEFLSRALGLTFVAASLLAVLYPQLLPGLQSNSSGPMNM